MVLFYFSLSFFLGLMFLRRFMELLLSKWQPQLLQTVASRWWQELCCGLVTHSVIVPWEVMHLLRLRALKINFI